MSAYQLQGKFCNRQRYLEDGCYLWHMQHVHVYLRTLADKCKVRKERSP